MRGVAATSCRSPCVVVLLLFLFPLLPSESGPIGGVSNCASKRAGKPANCCLGKCVCVVVPLLLLLLFSLEINLVLVVPHSPVNPNYSTKSFATSSLLTTIKLTSWRRNLSVELESGRYFASKVQLQQLPLSLSRHFKRHS